MRIYLDSNVLIAYLRSEIDSAFNMRFLDSEKFFIACRELGIEVMISELFLREIDRAIHLPRATVTDTFERLGVKTIFATTAEEGRARDISRKIGIHFSDAVHVANAADWQCGYIITWNLKDFEKAKMLVPCKSSTGFIEAFC